MKVEYFMIGIVLSILVLLIIAAGTFSIYNLVVITKHSNFCAVNFPSIYGYGVFDKDAGYFKTTTIEKGYIECCRNTYDKNHERVKECNIIRRDF